MTDLNRTDRAAAPDADGDSTHVRAAAALRRLARREDLKAAVLSTPALFDVLRHAAGRYVAGETRDEALATARALATPRGTRPGHRTTIDFMGEDTRDVRSAREATDEFLALVAALGPAPHDAILEPTSISLDLSHIGLAVEENGMSGARLAREHLEEIAAAASATGREVVISMEGSARTDAILEIHAAVAARFPHVGVTVQAALHRTSHDLATLLDRARAIGPEGAGRIRLVKGAYAEPAERAEPRGTALDARYAQLSGQLLEAAARGQRVSIATHDPSLLASITARVDTMGGRQTFTADALQFEQLHGVTPHRLDALAMDGFSTRFYLVYGREWYLYLCHRLAEHPPSLLEAFTDAVDALPTAPGETGHCGSAMTGSSARANRQ